MMRTTRMIMASEDAMHASWLHLCDDGMGMSLMPITFQTCCVTRWTCVEVAKTTDDAWLFGMVALFLPLPPPACQHACNMEAPECRIVVVLGAHALGKVLLVSCVPTALCCPQSCACSHIRMYGCAGLRQNNVVCGLHKERARVPCSTNIY